jgi:aminoglycoside 2'-N-acetyltransferase I
MRTAHTADLDLATLRSVRGLLDAAFADFDEHDWEHCLGGMHVLARSGGELVGHGSVVQRRLLHAGRALRAGFLEGVAVRPDRQGRGQGRAVMAELERVVRGGYELGALSTTEDAAGFYAAGGWQVWRGPTSALTPGGVVRTPHDDGGVFVLPVAVALDLDGELTCDWRDGDLW